MSIPSSRKARTTYGFRLPASKPALSTSNLSPANFLRYASAIWLRAELCVQTNKTFGIATSTHQLDGTGNNRLFIHNENGSSVACSSCCNKLPICFVYSYRRGHLHDKRQEATFQHKFQQGRGRL